MDPRYFRLTMSYLESLLDHLEDTDFGLFIFGQDDLARIRGTEMRIARDNVVFELGLFIGRLGRDRSFILMPKMASDFHLRPTFSVLALRRSSRLPDLIACKLRWGQHVTIFARQSANTRSRAPLQPRTCKKLSY